MPVPATVSTDGLLIEVFSSVQGEGVLVGCRQIFVRMAGCNLACAYCDTPFEPTEMFRVEENPGSMTVCERPNPVSAGTLCEIVSQWQRVLSHHSLSLTGGEPLLQAESLLEWLPQLSRIIPIYLETNGTLPDRLPPLLPYLSFVSMDIKLQSVSGQATPWREHQRFLALSAAKPCQVKIVVGKETPRGEIEAAAELLRSTAPETPLVIQPVTSERSRLDAARLLEIQRWGLQIHQDVRVIPQTHRFLGLL